MMYASGPLAHSSHCGSVMISGSEKRLYKKGWTWSSVSGPPRLSSSTPTVSGDTVDEEAAAMVEEPAVLSTAMPACAAAAGARLRPPGRMCCDTHDARPGSASSSKQHHRIASERGLDNEQASTTTILLRLSEQGVLAPPASSRQEPHPAREHQSCVCTQRAGVGDGLRDRRDGPSSVTRGQQRG